MVSFRKTMYVLTLACMLEVACSNGGDARTKFVEKIEAVSQRLEIAVAEGEDGRIYPAEVLLDATKPGNVSLRVDGEKVAHVTVRLDVERAGITQPHLSLADEEISVMNSGGTTNRSIIGVSHPPMTGDLPLGVYATVLRATLQPRRESGVPLDVSGTAYFRVTDQGVEAISIEEYSREVLPPAAEALDQNGDRVLTVVPEGQAKGRKSETELLELLRSRRIGMDPPVAAVVQETDASSARAPKPEAITE